MDPRLSSVSPDSAESSTVRPVACLRCRSRRSYCSKEQPACSRCRDGSHDCVYPEAGRKITISESYLRDLEARLRAYEDAARNTAGQTTPAASIAAQPILRRNHNSIDDAELDTNPLLEPLTNLVIDPSGRPRTRFFGSSSSTIFGRRFRDIVNPDSGGSDIDSEHTFYDQSALRPRRFSDVTHHARLPPYAFARRLFAAQYTYIGTIFSFIDPVAFEQQLQDAYKGPPDVNDREACLSYSKVLVTLAFGQLYSVNQWSGFDGPPGFEYFTQALQYLPDFHEDGSMLFVETIALIGYFLQNLNRRDAGFLYIGIALRMAISLALHQEVSSPGLDEVTKEHRRRLWWSVYSLDRILSVKSGNPIAIQDDDIGVAQPSPLPHEPAYGPPVVLRHYTELSRILGRIMRNIYRKAPKSGSSLMASVQNIMKSLSDWHREIPNELRFNPAKLSISRESVSTFVHYYQCINMTARPLLFHVVQKRLRMDPQTRQQDWKTGLHPTTIAVIETCVSAAQDTIAMMTIAAQKDLVATYGYMDGEHIFSAAIVLVMVCIAFPASAQDHSSMDAALELLRGMADRGNSHIGARHQLLVQLRSTIPGVRSDHAAAPAGAAQGENTHVSLLSPMDGAPLAGTGAVASVPAFPLVDNTALGEMFYDLEEANGGDFGLWEEGYTGYTNPDLTMEWDLTQWTQVAQNHVEENGTM